MNIIAKHEGQATVASREPQNWQAGASVELAAPQFGQLRVSACTAGILSVQSKCGLQQSCVRFLAVFLCASQWALVFVAEFLLTDPATEAQTSQKLHRDLTLFRQTLQGEFN